MNDTPHSLSEQLAAALAQIRNLEQDLQSEKVGRLLAEGHLRNDRRKGNRPPIEFPPLPKDEL